jgi:hypothetical protein
MKKILAIPIFALSIFLVSYGIPDAHATNLELQSNDANKVCEDVLGGSWDGASTCTVQGLVLRSTDTLQIDNDTALSATGTTTNNGTIINNGDMYNDGVLVNHGAINTTSGGIMGNHDILFNSAVINTTSNGFIDNSGIITNSGMIINNGTLENVGRISTTINASSAVINNTGTINLNGRTINEAGTMDNYGNMTNTGTFTNAGIINQYSNYITNDLGGTLTNKLLTVVISNGGEATYDLQSTSYDASDTANSVRFIDSGITAYAYNAPIFPVSTTTTDVVGSGTININGGKITNLGSITNPRFINVNSGTLDNTQGTVNNSGIVTKCGDGIISGTISGNSPVDCTTTTVEPSPSSDSLNNNIVYTVTVTDKTSFPSTPTETVSWDDGGAGGTFSDSGSCALSGSGGSATCTITYTASSSVASVTITASYGGDAVHSTSSGTSVLDVTPDVIISSIELQDQDSCNSIGGTWDGSLNTCTVVGFTLDSGNTLKVDSGINLINTGSINNLGIITSFGTITNSGNVTNSGTLTNNGTLTNAGQTNSTNYIDTASAVINNTGTINLNGRTINEAGTMDNYGNMTNTGNFTNAGIINQYSNYITNDLGGTLTNKPLTITVQTGSGTGYTVTYDLQSTSYDASDTANSVRFIDSGVPAYAYNAPIFPVSTTTTDVVDAGTININGGKITNLGSITNPRFINVNSGTLDNNGTITNTDLIQLLQGATLNNYGSVANSDSITNDGTINNDCTSVFNGGVTGNQPVTLCDTTFIEVSPVPLAKRGGNGPALFANAGSPFTFTATVFDTLTSSNIPSSSVFWYVNGTFLTSCPLSPSSTQDFASCPISYTPKTLPQFLILNATYGGDEEHHSSTHSYNLEMEQIDTIPPTTTAIPSGTEGADNWYISPVSITLSAVDNPGGSGVQSTSYSLDGGPQVTYSGPFTVTGDGNHTLTYNSTDNAGNVESPHILYVPIDTTPPVIMVPSNVTMAATGPQTVVTLGTATANDAVDGPVSVSNNATASYPVGVTIIQYTATDLAGNTATAYQSVTITDTTPPVLTLPVQVTAQATGPSGATVTYTVSATDLVDGPVTPVCIPPSGSTFAFGTTLVTCTATDAHNNQATGTFNVIVQNNVPPTLSITSPANNAIVNTATVKVSGTASDVVSISKISWKVDTGTISTVSGITPGPNVNWSFTTSSLSLGIHTIQVNATDSAGLVAISTVSITYAAPTYSIPPPSGSGQITFSSNAGGFTSLSSIQPSSLPTSPPPGSYPLGFFSWDITGFAPATSVTITVTSPTMLYHQSQYFKLVGGVWVSVPVTVHGNTMTFVISDNGPFDGDKTTGVITDPAAVAAPTDGRVTGGGNIGKGTNFSFDVRSDLDKTNSITGNLDYNDRYAKLDLDSNNVSFLSVDTTTSQATFAGTGDYDRHDKHDRHDISDTFIVTISDPDKSGSRDMFSITVTDPTGNIIYQNSGTVNGHIEIHKFADRDDPSDSGVQHGGNNNNGNKNSH